MKMNVRREGLLPVLLFAFAVFSLALPSFSQAQVDSTAVIRTPVAHVGSVSSASSTSGTGNATSSATFGGTPYTVGPVITPTTTGPEAEEHIAAAPTDSSQLASAISDFSRPLAGFLVNSTKFAVSTDNGSTWSESFVPETRDGSHLVTSDGLTWDANSDPVVAIDRSGNVFSSNLYINFVSQSNDGLYVSKGMVTNNQLKITATNPVATNSPSSPNSEDKEWLAVDNSNSAFSGNVYVCWTRFTPTSDHIRFSRSTNHGKSWQASFQLSPTSQNGGVQGCQVAVGPSGEVYVAWEVFFLNGLRQHFIAKSTNGGESFSEAAPLTPTFREVNFESSYRKNSFPALAVSPTNGAVADVFAAFISDIGTKVLFTESTDGSATFSTPVSVVDTSAGVQFFPAVSFDANGTAHMSWFDTRNSGSAQASQFDEFATFTRDGLSFAPNARVTPTQVVAGKSNSFIGDYSGIAAGGGFAHPVWNNGGFITLNTHLQTSTLTLP